tara:strand:+ start:96 stop:278 length:183 start_codon:yes stop_codon:yes gene_type:complete
MTEDRKFTNYKGEEIIITKERKWQLLADCIRSGQVEDRELQEEFRLDPEFKKWYMKKYSI